MAVESNDVVVTNTDDVKILNTHGTHKCGSEVEENMKNELDSTSKESNDDQKSLSTNSLNSNNVSIVTLDENADDSSAIDSDEDCEDVFSPSKMRATASNGIVLVNDGSNSNVPGVINSHEHDAPKLNIGSIAVQNSSGITFGNKTFYQGPVTIKQFLYDNNKWTPTDQGNDNPAFTGDGTANLDPKLSKEMGKVPIDDRSSFLFVLNSNYDANVIRVGIGET